MVIFYGDRYETSGQYFQIKLIVNSFTLITYCQLMLSVGRNKYYYNVHMYVAIILIGLQYRFVKLIISPIAITIVWITLICYVALLSGWVYFRKIDYHSIIKPILSELLKR